MTRLPICGMITELSFSVFMLTTGIDELIFGLASLVLLLGCSGLMASSRSMLALPISDAKMKPSLT